MQSQEEIKIVFDYWFQHFAPEGFLNTDKNGEKIGAEFQRRGVAVVTFENISEIVKSLGGALDYAPKNTKPVEPVVQKTTWKAPARPTSVVDVNDERNRFAEAVEDVNSAVFARLQDEARADFEKICRGYQASTPMGKVDHAVTFARRELLRGIKVVDKRRNNKGEQIVLYTHMLRLASEALRAFEKEDINRNQQRW